MQISDKPPIIDARPLETPALPSPSGTTAHFSGAAQVISSGQKITEAYEAGYQRPGRSRQTRQLKSNCRPMHLTGCTKRLRPKEMAEIQ